MSKKEVYKQLATRMLSPEREDPFAENKNSNLKKRTYKEIRTEQILDNERQDISRKLLKKTERRTSGFQSNEEKKRKTSSSTNEESVKSTRSMWDLTPGGDVTPRRFGETPTPGRFTGETPFYTGETPTPRRFRSNWDSKTPIGMTPNTLHDATPSTLGGATPTPNQYGLFNNLTPEKLQMLRWERELDERNRPMTDQELDDILPKKGYEVRNYIINFYN